MAVRSRTSVDGASENTVDTGPAKAGHYRNMVRLASTFAVGRLRRTGTPDTTGLEIL
jgi:hypothetical protein